MVLIYSFLGFYRPRKLGLSFPRLYDIPEGEAMASALLQVIYSPLFKHC